MMKRYSIDEGNRLVIADSRRGMPLVTHGSFMIDKENRLRYKFNKKTSRRKGYNLPNEIIFKGSWQLNSNYDLELVLDKTSQQCQGDILTIKANIISADGDTLAFEVKTYDQDEFVHLQVLKLGVTWLADPANRLSFIVKKRIPDIITLEGDWQINQNQQISYLYEKVDLKRKTRISQSLEFEGFWRISSANKLTYIFKRSLESKFDFRAQIETPNIYPRKGVIKYRLGIGLRKPWITKTQIISLYGTWKFSRRLGLSFQMDYGDSGIYESQFSADIYFNKNNEVTFVLKDKTGESLGISITLSHRFLKKIDAEAFLRLKASQKESRVDAGVRVPF